MCSKLAIAQRCLHIVASCFAHLSMAVGSLHLRHLLVQCQCGILTAQLIRLPQPRGSKLSQAMLTLRAPVIYALTIDYRGAKH